MTWVLNIKREPNVHNQSFYTFNNPTKLTLNRAKKEKKEV